MIDKKIEVKGFINKLMEGKECSARRISHMKLFNSPINEYLLIIDSDEVDTLFKETSKMEETIKRFLISQGEMNEDTKLKITVVNEMKIRRPTPTLPKEAFMKGKDYLFSVDAETDGLFGNAFSIGVAVYDYYGNEFDSFYAVIKDADKAVTNEWVKENVLPKLDTNNALIVDSYEDLIKEFSEFYIKYKDNAATIWHMGQIVEVFLFREAVRLGYLGIFDTPYLPIEMSNLLMYYALTGDSVDNVRVYEGPVGNTSLIVKKSDNFKNTHNALYDAQVTAELFFKITK